MSFFKKNKSNLLTSALVHNTLGIEDEFRVYFFRIESETVLHYHVLKRKKNFLTGNHEDQLGISTKAVRTVKYLLIAFLLIHFASCGWYILACPNEADVEGVFKCYSCGWAVIKNQSKKTSSF